MFYVFWTAIYKKMAEVSIFFNFFCRINFLERFWKYRWYRKMKYEPFKFSNIMERRYAMLWFIALVVLGIAIS